jgi:hypothetical protein
VPKRGHANFTTNEARKRRTNERHCSDDGSLWCVIRVVCVSSSPVRTGEEKEYSPAIQQRAGSRLVQDRIGRRLSRQICLIWPQLPPTPARDKGRCSQRATSWESTAVPVVRAPERPLCRARSEIGQASSWAWPLSWEGTKSRWKNRKGRSRAIDPHGQSTAGMFRAAD